MLNVVYNRGAGEAMLAKQHMQNGLMRAELPPQTRLKEYYTDLLYTRLYLFLNGKIYIYRLQPLIYQLSEILILIYILLY